MPRRKRAALGFLLVLESNATSLRAQGLRVIEPLPPVRTANESYPPIWATAPDIPS